MYAQVKKSKENKGRAVADSVAQKKNYGRNLLSINDKRPEIKQLQKIQTLVDKRSKSDQVIQKLSKQQKANITKYELTPDFTNKHVCADASRETLMSVAASRGVAASTIIKESAKEIQNKALQICLTGDNSQVAAETHPRYGNQIKVKMTKLMRATIVRGEFQGWGTEPFVIVGAWDGSQNKKTVKGTHFQEDPNVGENDEEVLGL